LVRNAENMPLVGLGFGASEAEKCDCCWSLGGGLVWK